MVQRLGGVGACRDGGARRWGTAQCLWVERMAGASAFALGTITKNREKRKGKINVENKKQTFGECASVCPPRTGAGDAKLPPTPSLSTPYCVQIQAGSQRAERSRADCVSFRNGSLQLQPSLYNIAKEVNSFQKDTD